MDSSGAGIYVLPAAAAAPPPPPPPMQQQQVVPYGVEIPNRVFVGGCPYNMTELELSKFFSSFGEVKDTKIITDRDGGKSKGYGFVTFANEEDAVKVYSMGSIYYQQKKLNVSKAIRKYGGQYQKANQEYVNGQRMVWIHPNGYLLNPQEGGWNFEQFPSYSQPVKPCYSLLPPPPPPPPQHGLYHTQQQYHHPSTNAWIGLGHTPQHNQQICNYPVPDHTHLYNAYPTPVVSTMTNSGNESLESSGSSLSSSHHALPSSQEDKYDIDVKALQEKTKQLSLDSAYTSEADLDASHNSTATNSRTGSPKLATRKEKAEENEEKKEEEEGEESSNTPQHLPTTFKEFVPRSISPPAPQNATFSPHMQQPLQHYQISPPHYITSLPPTSPMSLQFAAQQGFSYGYGQATLLELPPPPPPMQSLVSAPTQTFNISSDSCST